MEHVTLSSATITNSSTGEKTKKIENNEDNSLFAMLLQSITMFNSQEVSADPSLKLNNYNINYNQQQAQEILNSNLSNFKQFGMEAIQNLENNDLANTEAIPQSLELESLVKVIEDLVQLLNTTQVSKDRITNLTSSLPKNQQQLLSSIIASIDNKDISFDLKENDELISKLVTTLSNGDVQSSNTIKSNNKYDIQLKELNDKIQTLLQHVNTNDKTLQNGIEKISKLDDTDSKLQPEIINQTVGVAKNINLNSKQEFVNNQQPVTEHLQQNKDFTSELGKIMIKSFKLPDGISQTNIQLHPEELGQINVKLTAHQGAITAQFMADTVLGKELLENQLHQLRQNLVQQGFQVDKIDVQVANTSNTSNTDLRNGFQFSQQQQSQQQQSQQQNRQKKNSFHLNPYSDEADGFMGVSTILEGIDYTA